MVVYGGYKANPSVYGSIHGIECFISDNITKGKDKDNEKGNDLFHGVLLYVVYILACMRGVVNDFVRVVNIFIRVLDNLLFAPYIAMCVPEST